MVRVLLTERRHLADSGAVLVARKLVRIDPLVRRAHTLLPRGNDVYETIRSGTDQA